MKPNKTWLIVGGIGATLVLGLVWWNSNKSAPSGSQNAVNPNAQIGAGAFSQGTSPDFGNLLSYNQVPGIISAPQATSVSSLIPTTDGSWMSTPIVDPNVVNDPVTTIKSWFSTAPQSLGPRTPTMAGGGIYM